MYLYLHSMSHPWDKKRKGETFLEAINLKQ
jgi:hypothetical protein